METTLFHRLGGSHGIGLLVDDIVEAHLANPAVRARYLPIAADPDRMEVAKGHLCTFLEAGSGGPSAYSGRSMPDTHRGMNICETEYMAVMDDIMGVLARHDIDEQSQKDVLAIAWSLKGEIMRL